MIRKAFTSAGAILVFVVPVALKAQSEEPEVWAMVRVGDIDRSGQVDVADAHRLAAYLAGERPLGVRRVVADIDGDGRITTGDLSLLSQQALGLWFPVDSKYAAHPVEIGSSGEDGSSDIGSSGQDGIAVLSIHNNTGEPVEWVLN